VQSCGPRAGSLPAGLGPGGFLCSLFPSSIPGGVPGGSRPAGFGPWSRWSRHRRYRLCGLGSGSLTPVVWPRRPDCLGPGDIAHSPRSSERLSPLLLNTDPPERPFWAFLLVPLILCIPVVFFYRTLSRRWESIIRSFRCHPHSNEKQYLSCCVTFRMHMHHAEEYPHTIVITTSQNLGFRCEWCALWARASKGPQGKLKQ
jgi:hypothetical protein